MTTGSNARVPRPRPGWTSMNPPPPMLPASGNVTASANPVATAASTALPPWRRMSLPTSDAGAETDTTIPRLPMNVGAGRAMSGGLLRHPVTTPSSSNRTTRPASRAAKREARKATPVILSAAKNPSSPSQATRDFSLRSRSRVPTVPASWFACGNNCLECFVRVQKDGHRTFVD